MKRDHDAIRKELESLKADGLIKPADVVEFASDPETALHHCFTWDDSAAAIQFRLWEANRILRVYVQVEQVKGKAVRAFVSLTSDRTQPGGGYRTVADVMSDEALKDQMLADALTMLRNMQQKYKSIQELQRVWDAVDEVEHPQPVRKLSSII